MDQPIHKIIGVNVYPFICYTSVSRTGSSVSTIHHLHPKFGSVKLRYWGFEPRVRYHSTLHHGSLHRSLQVLVTIDEDTVLDKTKEVCKIELKISSRHSIHNYKGIHLLFIPSH